MNLPRLQKYHLTHDVWCWVLPATRRFEQQILAFGRYLEINAVLFKSPFEHLWCKVVERHHCHFMCQLVLEDLSLIRIHIQITYTNCIYIFHTHIHITYRYYMYRLHILYIFILHIHMHITVI